MQLSVFLTPLLTDHAEMGFGVCYQLESVVDTNHQQMMNMPMSTHDMMTAMSPHHTKHPHSHQDPQCQICSVMSHLTVMNLIPLSISFIWLMAEQIQVKFHSYTQRLLTFDHLLFPPGRAPPTV